MRVIITEFFAFCFSSRHIVYMYGSLGLLRASVLTVTWRYSVTWKIELMEELMLVSMYVLSSYLSSTPLYRFLSLKDINTAFFENEM